MWGFEDAMGCGIGDPGVVRSYAKMQRRVQEVVDQQERLLYELPSVIRVDAEPLASGLAHAGLDHLHMLELVRATNQQHGPIVTAAAIRRVASEFELVSHSELESATLEPMWRQAVAGAMLNPQDARGRRAAAGTPSRASRTTARTAQSWPPTGPVSQPDKGTAPERLSRVLQTDHTPESGNALQACVASLLRLPLCEVPNFIAQPEGYWPAMLTHASSRGLSMMKVPLSEGRLHFASCPGTLCILRGTSPRGAHGHVIVAEVAADGRSLEPVHDPHPDGGFLHGMPEWAAFITYLWPAGIGVGGGSCGSRGLD